jgi:hypothetical protein
MQKRSKNRSFFLSCYQKGAFMSHFEELNSSAPLCDGRVYPDVEALESEAFNRGLPEKGMKPPSAGEHGFSKIDQQPADDF